MIVVSDTSPITALLTVGHEVPLRRLFGEVVISSAVKEELMLLFPTSGQSTGVHFMRPAASTGKKSAVAKKNDCMTTCQAACVRRHRGAWRRRAPRIGLAFDTNALSTPCA
jgi:predicted nucleic acid-binding protein